MEMYFHESICMVCGREFVVGDPGQWVYRVKIKKGGTKAVCSWKCAQEYRRKEIEEQELKRSERRGRHPAGNK